MKKKLKFFIYKFLCITERIRYKFLFYNLNLDPWHLSGTFYCRKYKIKTLEIINRINPDYYIDIGCGLGEILKKVDLKKANKFGFDIDDRLQLAIKKTKPDFYFSSNKEKFYNLLRKKIVGKNKKIIVSLLGFSHKITDKKLFKYLTKLNEILGPYILITDSVFDKSKEYRYSHKSFLDKQEQIIEYIERIDKIRSLYCISFKNRIIEY